MNSTPRLIAFYLPQFHPIPENDEWWGKGFTEWTNTAKAKPMFRGHYQPHIPADLGFYDLRCPETREDQASLARTYGIEGFCYFHYWFAGKQILERPFNEVLSSGRPDFPFCLCWANQTWTGVWHGAPNRVLIAQTYPGVEDHRRHFQALLPALLDPRYIHVNGKPLFVIYAPLEIPALRDFTDLWRELAVAAGLQGLHFIAESGLDAAGLAKAGLDGSVHPRLPPRRREWIDWRRHPIKAILREVEVRRELPTIYQFAQLTDVIIQDHWNTHREHPCLIPGWDNTARSGADGLVLHGSTPELFRGQVRKAFDITRKIPPQERIVFIKAWNEWAEGNHLEPDLRFGHGYLQVIREELEREIHPP